jgi:protein MpaA
MRAGKTAVAVALACAISSSPAVAVDDPVVDPTPPAPSEPPPTTPPPVEPPVEPEPTPTRPPDGPDPLPRKLVIGQSVQGRKIIARRKGRADAARVLLVLGQMHGNEPYGRYVVDEVRKLAPRAGTAVWTVRTMNPDGARMRSRRNARAVDLNRNFPQKWRPGPRGSYFYPGRKPASEPETRAFIDFVRTVSPDAIVSYHQKANAIDKGKGKTRKWVRRLSRDLRLPVSKVDCVTKCVGTMTGWFNGGFPGWAVTVELPSRISSARQRSMARAMIRLAPDLKPTMDRETR